MKHALTLWYRAALGLLLFLLIYDGSIRKWILLETEQLVFIAKDALLIVSLVFWVLAHGSKQLPAILPPQVRLLVVLYAWWVMLQLFNPNLPNLLVGLWGIKSHLLYASILILLPAAYPDLQDFVRRLEKIYPWLVVPVCSLAFAQLVAPADSFLNQQIAGAATALAYFGEAGLVRVSGPFSYISGMAAFVQMSCLLGLALYLGGARTRLFLIGLGFSLAALPVTGSRAVIAVVAIGGIIVLTGAVAARLIGLRTVVQVVVVMAALSTISFYTQDNAWDALAQRTLSSREDENRLVTAFTNAFDFWEIAGFTGFGSGAANLGSVVLAGDVVPFSWLPNSMGFEEESGRLVLELGIIGWALSLAMRGGMLIWAVALTFKGKSRHARLAGVLALPIMALGVHQGNGVFAVPLAAVHYWFSVALMAMARYQEKVPRNGTARTLQEQQQALLTR